MVPQFPRDMVPLLRCNNDAGELAIAKELRGDDHGVLDAVLRCKGCGAEFRTEDGIARLLPNQLSPEDKQEMSIRDTIDYYFTNPGPFVPPRNLEIKPNPRSLFIKSARRWRSSSCTAVNSSPNPRPGLTCRTTASALICPSSTRK